jgi:hypothetical protein
MVCPKCQSHRMHRIPRKGFLRTALAPIFGFYPWRCSVCRTEKLLRTRGTRRRTHDLEAPKATFQVIEHKNNTSVL